MSRRRFTSTTITTAAEQSQGRKNPARLEMMPGALNGTLLIICTPIDAAKF
jgi:hypothetical protein